jgi:hypothetical protein
MRRGEWDPQHLSAVFLALVAVMPLLMLDLLFEVSLDLDALAVCAIVPTSVIILTVRRRGAEFLSVLIACAILATLLIAVGDWTPVKALRRRLADVRPGMTEADVRSVMSGFPFGTGWPDNQGEPVSLEGRLVFRSTAEPGDSNWGVVTLVDGRVTSVEFSPD